MLTRPALLLCLFLLPTCAARAPQAPLPSATAVATTADHLPTATAAPAPPVPAAALTPPQLRLPSTTVPRRQAVVLRLAPTQEQFSGSTEIAVELQAPTRVILVARGRAGGSKRRAAGGVVQRRAGGQARGRVPGPGG